LSPPPKISPEDFLASVWDKSLYINFAVLVQVLGLWYVLCPADTYGPTWSYFHQLPHKGTGLGICLILLSAGQLTAIANNRPRLTGALLFLSGFVFLTSGLIIFAEGVFGHMGLQEAPLMCIIAGYKFAQSAKLRAQFKQPRK
jgi:hypothetical protein